MEWQMVTRGKAKAGRARRTTIRAIARGTEREEGPQRSAPGFEATSTAARKRKAEDSVNDKLIAMAENTSKLVIAQKQTAESQKAFLESNKAILDRNKALLECNKELIETIKRQGEEIKELNALL